MSRSTRRRGRYVSGLVCGWVLLFSVIGSAIPPVVIGRSPGVGEELAVDAPVVLIFDQAMDRPSVEDAFSVEPTLAGRHVWGDDRTVHFLPSAGWARDTEYRVSLSAEAANREGESLAEPYTFRFRTVGFLEVTQAVPADGIDEVAVDSTLLVMFNRPVVPLTALSDPTAGTLPAPITLEPEVPGSGEWLNTSVYVFTPTEPLRGGTTYTATVPAGLVDTTGGIVPQDVRWRFTTERPKVVWYSPERNEDLVPIDTEIRVMFNMPIALESARGRFTLRGGRPLGDRLSEPVEGVLSTDGSALIFEPSEPLAFDREYTVVLDPGITAVGGGWGLKDPLQWRFRTVPLPKILGTTPEDGESSASPYTSLLIHFNVPIDPESVLENLSIEPTPEPADLRGYFRRWDTTYVVQFGAQPSQQYTVTIGPGIADPYGNTTGQTVAVSFRTAPLDPIAWLHLPGRTGTFSTYEPSRIFVAHRNLDAVELTLTRLDLDEYFEAIGDWYDYSPPAQDRVRRWTVPLSSALNKIGYTSVDLLPEDRGLEPGIYLIDLRADAFKWNRWQHRHLLIASPVNLTIKTAFDETLVWATDLNTGTPVAGLILRTYDGDGDPLDVSVTDRDGLATFPGSESVDWRGMTVVGVYPFTAGRSEWDDGISVWNYGFSSESPIQRRTYLDTDRPIYRPGQTVFFRGILREEDDVSYSLPDASSVDLAIWDAAWELVYEATLPLDPYGTFSGEVMLAEEASLGTYRIEVSLENAYVSHTFEVAAYRPPEFDVSVIPERDEVARGEAIDVSVELTYFFGAPVADQEVVWRVFSETYRFSPSHLGRYTFDDVDDPWYGWNPWWGPSEPSVPVLEGSGRTDRNGRLLVRLPEDIASLSDEGEVVSGSRRLTLEATATGSDGQTLSGRGGLVIHGGNFYVGLASPRAIGRAGDPMEIDVLTVNWRGERCGGQGLTYEIYRREWTNVFEENEAGGGRWTWVKNDIEITSGEIVTEAQGDARISFVPPVGGTYKVIVAGRDEVDRAVRASLFVWVSGSGTISWRRSNDDRIQLISDRVEYSVGDTAEILIPSPYPGDQWALITVERGGILSREVVRLESNSAIYRLPITEEHIPNIYVSVVLVRGRDDALAAAEGHPVADTKVGYVLLSVSSQPKVLQIELTPSKRDPQPGETVDYDVRVTDSEGHPVQASLSFDLVDKAVLTLLPRIPNAILNTFYAQRGLGVDTASGLTISINRLVIEQLEEAEQIAQSKYALGEDRAPGMAVPLAAAETGAVEREAGARSQLPSGIGLREDFQDTAYWSAQVITDSTGRARVRVDLPDNLTTWVVRGVGVTTDTLVGEGTDELLVTKPLLIRPVAPRFFVVGDRVRLAANLTNQTDTERSVEVTLGQTGLALEDPAVQTVVVPAGGEATVTWWATVLDVSTVDLAFSAVSGELSDAARPRLTTGPEGTLPAYRYTAPETVGTAGQLDAEGSRAEIIALPPHFDGGRSELLVRLETSLAAAMQQGLDSLEHFEYECTEQVVSRFLPNVLTLRALQRLGIENPELAERLPDLVAEGMEKLYVRQNPDGGWGWWDLDASNVHLTAYAIFSLLQARESGFLVNGAVLERALDFLEQALVSTNELTSYVAANRQAWGLFVLTEAGRDSIAVRYADDLYDARGKLSHYARAFLALALDRLGAPATWIDTLVSDLYREAIFSATGAHWEEADYDWWAMNTDTRSTAVILAALVRLDSSQPLLPNVVRWLMVARKDGIWETTQETAWALIALTEWMTATDELAGAYDYSVSLNGEALHEGTAIGRTLAGPTVLTVGADRMDPAAGNRLIFFRGEGDGRLYYTAHLSVRLPVEEVDPVSRGIIVQRQYAPVDCPLDEVCPETSAAAVGDSIQVRLTIIAPHDLYYVVVEDPFPAGCEAIDPTLATTGWTDLDPGLFRQGDDDWPWFPWWRWYSRYELRDEKLVLFAEYLPAGTYSYQYSLRATLPGEYRVMPTSAYEFYFPEVFGRSEGRLFTVSE